MPNEAVAAPSSDQPSLRRAIGPGLLLLFIVGDILGTGVYALTGKVAGQVGGIAWLPFLCSFGVALLTALSYLELVTKYPRAGGAAVYTQRAFGIHFLTFIVAFMVMSSGLTSASAAAKAFAGNLNNAAGWGMNSSSLGVLLVAFGFMGLLMVVNLRGVSESVKVNVVLTLVELTGLLIIIGIGIWAIAHGDGDTGRLIDVQVEDGKSVFGAVTAATALAFFAMVGFEDSVNMAEETKDPVRIFPRIMLLGLTITAVIYVLVAISSVALVSPAELGEGEAPLLKVVEAGAPRFPVGVFAVISMFAVANSALINMLMASRLLYGMAQDRVLPLALGKVGERRTPWVSIIFTTALSFVLIAFADLRSLGGTTSLLLLVVFAVCNTAVLVLRKDVVEHKHFRAPTIAPILGAVVCAFLASPLSQRHAQDYVVAGWLVAAGVGLWLLHWALTRLVQRLRGQHQR